MSLVQSWNQIETLDLETMKRKIFTGENVMLVRNVIEPHATVPAHQHPHEQILYVVSGECDAVIGGETHRMAAESMALIPSNVEHSVLVTSEEPLVAIDIFSPIRTDFLKK